MKTSAHENIDAAKKSFWSAATNASKYSSANFKDPQPAVKGAAADWSATPIQSQQSQFPTLVVHGFHPEQDSGQQPAASCQEQSVTYSKTRNVANMEEQEPAEFSSNASQDVANILGIPVAQVQQQPGTTRSWKWNDGHRWRSRQGWLGSTDRWASSGSISAASIHGFARSSTSVMTANVPAIAIPSCIASSQRGILRNSYGFLEIPSAHPTASQPALQAAAQDCQ